MTQEFPIILSADEAAKAEAAAALYRYNVAITGTDDRIPIGAVLCDGSGKALGGLWGRTELGLLFLDSFRARAFTRSVLRRPVACRRRRRGKGAGLQTRRRGDKQLSGAWILHPPRLCGIRPRSVRVRWAGPRLSSQGTGLNGCWENPADPRLAIGAPSDGGRRAGGWRSACRYAGRRGRPPRSASLARPRIRR